VRYFSVCNPVPVTVNITVLDCPGKTTWLASTNSIRILCGPGGIPARSIVLLSLASAHHQGRSSTWTCRCPTRGDALRAPFPEHWYDVHILRPVLNPDHALVQQIRKRGVHDQFWRGLVLNWDIG